MEDENKKYEKVLNMLRESKPVLLESETFTENIIRLLQEEKPKLTLPELIIEYLFGWVYIGWVRRSLVAVAIVVVVFFGYQQALILRRLNDVSGQRIRDGAFLRTNMTDELSNKMLIYRITGRKLSDEKITVSEKEIDEMISSLNKLQVKYKDLINLIEDDPQLKKYIEERIKENRKN